MSNRTKSLFPEMEQEILDDRKAEKREIRAQARGYIQKSQGVADWILSELTIHGPMLSVDLHRRLARLSKLEEDEDEIDCMRRGLRAVYVAHYLWLDLQLWRTEVEDHPTEGTFLYGIRGVHDKRRNWSMSERELPIGAHAEDLD